MESTIEYEIVRVKSKEKMRRNALGPDELQYFQGNNDDDTEKENAAPCLRDKTKNRLQRLGVLYGDGEISSPIHRSEDTWAEDAGQDDPDRNADSKDKYSEERQRRFRALASTINSWEDDVRHISPKKEEVERYDRFGNLVGSKAVKHDLVRPVGARPTPTSNPSSPKKKVAWDRKIINTLESQGFKRCDSEEHLVYDYVSPENRECTSPRKAPIGTKRNQPFPCENTPKKSAFVQNKQHTYTKPTREEQPKKMFVSSTVPLGNSISGSASNERERRASPLRQAVVCISPARTPSPQRKVPLAPAALSPQRKASPQKSSAVLEMAAHFESSSQPARSNRMDKDPALLSVSEKRAVFEKNRGFIPIPQQAVSGPTAQLQRVQSPVRQPNIMPGRCEISKSPERRQMTTHSAEGVNNPIRHNVNQAVIERFKEIEALRHRWDRNKAVSSINEVLKAEHASPYCERMEVVETPAPSSSSHRNAPPLPPPLPEHLLSPCGSSVPVPSFITSPSRGRMEVGSPSSPPRQIRMGTRSPVRSGESPPRQERRLPRVLSIKEKSPIRDHRYPEIKKIRVSPPKKGHIYPSVSDIETESEVPESDLDPIEEEGSEPDEGEVPDNTSFGFSSELDSSVGSLGKQIVRQASKSNLKRRSNGLDTSDLRTSSTSSSWSYSESESRVLREMDDLLDEAMLGVGGVETGPSPPSPKRLREETHGGFDTDSSSSNNEMVRLPVQTKALVHTVSDYRKQQSISTTPKVRREVRTAEDFPMPTCSGIAADSTPEEELVLDRIRELQTEISKQLETISQASKALNLCHSTPGFGGSSAEVEAQRLLLISRSRWTAMTEEVDRLKVEKKLKPGIPGSLEQGHITLSNITLPVKSFQSGGSSSGGSNASVIVIVKSGATLLHTEILTIDKKSMRDGKLNFQKSLTLKGLYSDFTASIEVYGYSQKKSDVSCQDSKSHTPSKKEKHKKQKDRCGFLPVESPAGPNVVRSSAFQLWGYAVFSLREVNRHSFTLSKVPYTCPLDGSLEIAMASSMQSQVEHAGFLTVYEDVSGFGAWKRRWAVLRGSAVAFWAYPDQYKEGKVAMDTIDLTHVTSQEACLAPRDLCARPHTILLQSRVRDTSITESLVARREGDFTVLTFLLSADTKEERLQWCHQLNQVLHLLKAWKVTRM